MLVSERGVNPLALAESPDSRETGETNRVSRASAELEELSRRGYGEQACNDDGFGRLMDCGSIPHSSTIEFLAAPQVE